MALEQQQNVALVSHSSSGTMAKVQKDLIAHLNDELGPNRVAHFPLRAQLRKGSNREGTHRSRSFLFATIGMVVARAFELDRVDFYENGVVSLNLPPVEQVVGARATRSTHPRALAGLSQLFSLVLDRPCQVQNPYFWRTKREVVERIENLGFGGQIRYTRSCANVRSASRMHPHCGRCSQCIDRRFAMLSAGLAHQDPDEAYAVDLMTGPRTTVQDKEMALSYVRNARVFRACTDAQFLGQFGEVADALRHLDVEPKSALSRLVELHRRHGRSVTEVMERALSERRGEATEDGSLLALYRAVDAEVGSRGVTSTEAMRGVEPIVWAIELDTDRKVATIQGAGEIRNTNFETLVFLAQLHLDCLGRGLVPEDFPAITERKLLDEWSLADGSTVRRRIQSLRKTLTDLVGEDGMELVENIPGHGYRLAPDRVSIHRVPAKK